MHLGGGTVDFVGEDEVGEDRAALHPELGGAGVKDFGAHDVCGQHVRGELDPVELRIHQRCQRFQGQRLGEAGHAFQQHMPAHQQGNQEPVHHGGLSDQIAAQFRAQRLDPVGGFLHGIAGHGGGGGIGKRGVGGHGEA